MVREWVEGRCFNRRLPQGGGLTVVVRRLLACLCVMAPVLTQEVGVGLLRMQYGKGGGGGGPGDDALVLAAAGNRVRVRGLG